MVLNVAQVKQYTQAKQMTACCAVYGNVIVIRDATIADFTHFLLALAGNKSTSSSVFMSSSWSRSTPRYVNLRKVRGFLAASSAMLGKPAGCMPGLESSKSLCSPLSKGGCPCQEVRHASEPVPWEAGFRQDLDSFLES